MIYHTNTLRLTHYNHKTFFESIFLYKIYWVLIHASLMAYISVSHWAGDTPMWTNDGLVNLRKIAPRGLNELKTINQHVLMASFDFYSKIIGCIFSKRSSPHKLTKISCLYIFTLNYHHIFLIKNNSFFDTWQNLIFKHHCLVVGY